MSLNVFLVAGGRLLISQREWHMYGWLNGYLPRELERAVHRVGKVLPERCEQQRAVIAHPKIARALDKLIDALLARLERIGGV